MIEAVTRGLRPNSFCKVLPIRLFICLFGSRDRSRLNVQPDLTWKSASGATPVGNEWFLKRRSPGSIPSFG
jgi:hypothetical protein